ncbi:MAG: hypothetical protein RLZZ491_2014 [Pseudomonadota bacterium]|jgi:cytochrome c553
MRHHVLGAACMAVFLSLQPAGAQSAPDAAALYASTCAACHGRTGRGVSVYPSLVGRADTYITERLTRYRAREKLGPNSGLMIPVAVKLSDAEIAGLSAFISDSFR